MGASQATLEDDLQAWTPAPNLANITNSTNDGFAVWKALNVFQAYLVLPICIIGLFGNALSVVVFSRTRKKDSATSQYCLALAISDSGMVVLVGIKNWLSQGLRYLTDGRVSINPVVTSVVVCKSLRYVEQTSMLLSSWIIVLFSAERCYAVWQPLKRNSRLTTQSRVVTILLLVAFAFLFKIYIPYYYTVFDQMGGKNCWYPLEMTSDRKVLLLMVDIFSNIGLPCVLIFALNIAISVKIVRSTARITTKSDTTEFGHRQRREFRIVLNLLCVSTFFFVCTMPTVVMWSYVDHLLYVAGDDDKGMKLFPAALLTDSLTIVNYSMNFLIYGLSLDYYRDEVRKMIRACRSVEGTEHGDSSLEQETSTISMVHCNKYR